MLTEGADVTFRNLRVRVFLCGEGHVVKSLGTYWILSQCLKEELGHKLEKKGEERKKVRIRNGLRGLLKRYVGAEGKDSVKCLFVRMRPEFNPHVKMAGVVAHACNSNNGEAGS